MAFSLDIEISCRLVPAPSIEALNEDIIPNWSVVLGLLAYQSHQAVWATAEELPISPQRFICRHNLCVI